MFDWNCYSQRITQWYQLALFLLRLSSSIDLDISSKSSFAMNEDDVLGTRGSDDFSELYGSSCFDRGGHCKRYKNKIIGTNLIKWLSHLFWVLFSIHKNSSFGSSDWAC